MYNTVLCIRLNRECSITSGQHNEFSFVYTIILIYVMNPFVFTVCDLPYQVKQLSSAYELDHIINAFDSLNGYNPPFWIHLFHVSHRSVPFVDLGFLGVILITFS
jgi:hypothetical protein